MIKIYIFIFIMSLTVCESYAINIDELTADDKEKILPYPMDFDFKSSQFEFAIIQSQVMSGSDLIEYFYKCDGLPIKEKMDNTIFINNKNVGVTYSNKKTGVLVKSWYKSKTKLHDKELMRLLLYSFAKYGGINYTNLIYKDINYIQWCILKENKNEVEIMEYIKLNKHKK